MGPEEGDVLVDPGGPTALMLSAMLSLAYKATAACVTLQELNSDSNNNHK